MIKDSGNRTVFDTGAVRDIQKDKGRMDLLPLGVVSCWLYKDLILSMLEQYKSSGDRGVMYNILELFSAEYKSKTDMLIEVSVHYKEGADKYAIDNWKLGIPLSSFISSAVRHYLQFKDGQTDERHDRAFVWNILGAIWTHENKPEMMDLPFVKRGTE